MYGLECVRLASPDCAVRATLVLSRYFILILFYFILFYFVFWNAHGASIVSSWALAGYVCASPDLHRSAPRHSTDRCRL
jgi:hypothetical protein